MMCGGIWLYLSFKLRNNYCVKGTCTYTVIHMHTIGRVILRERLN